MPYPLPFQLPKSNPRALWGCATRGAAVQCAMLTWAAARGAAWAAARGALLAVLLCSARRSWCSGAACAAPLAVQRCSVSHSRCSGTAFDPRRGAVAARGTPFVRNARHQPASQPVAYHKESSSQYSSTPPPSPRRLCRLAPLLRGRALLLNRAPRLASLQQRHARRIVSEVRLGQLQPLRLK